MAFDDVRLPDDVERGAQGGPSFSTSVTTLANGREQRNANWSGARHSFNVAYGVQSIDNVQAVRSFFFARQGRLNSFRFKDWTDYKAINQPLVSIGGGFVGLAVHYGNYIRHITRIVAGTLTINGVPWTEESLGLINGAALGALASFEFDIPVRFDTDSLTLTADLFNAAEIPSINIIEVLEDSLTLNTGI